MTRYRGVYRYGVRYWEWKIHKKKYTHAFWVFDEEEDV